MNMSETILRYFGKSADIDKILEDMNLSSKCIVEGSDDFDNRILVGEIASEDYFELCERLGDGLYSEEDKPLGAVLIDFLKENNLIIATAESCTGGMMASRIVDIPGASKVFHEGIVCYTNQSKMDRLAVSEKTLDTCSAVSEESAREMALGLLSEYVDVGVSTTGIAGPSGETVLNVYKPAGLVYIGIVYRNMEPLVLRFNFRGNRDTVRRSATNSALFFTYKYLRDNL